MRTQEEELNSPREVNPRRRTKFTSRSGTKKKNYEKRDQEEELREEGPRRRTKFTS
jgi:hypothetical protein